MSKLNSKTTCTGLDWNTMLGLLQRLKRDDRLQDYLLVATGSYFGLRVNSPYYYEPNKRTIVCISFMNL